jgi:CHAT domain-containing protein
MDRVVSSYTTTVRDLFLQMKAAADTTLSIDPEVLIVALTNTPGAAQLPAAEHELRFLSAMFPGATVLSNWSATRASVRRALPGRQWAHFACHAGSDIKHPLNSGLALADGLFSVRDICKIKLGSGELAVLSGCQTSQPGINLADEAIHVASAFQLAGYRHVIGTMWPIEDRVAATFAEYFYTGLRTSGRDPAFALHSAVRKLRDTYREMPVIWAPVTHFGPSHSMLDERVSEPYGENSNHPNVAIAAAVEERSAPR